MNDLLKVGNGYKTAIGLMLYVVGGMMGAQGNAELMATMQEWGTWVGMIGVAHKAVKMK